MVAACEQLAICGFVYQKDQEGLLTFLGQDSQLLVWQMQTSSWPPSFAVIHSGPGRYFVVIEGTTNVSQALLHYVGCFSRKFDGNVRVNGPWLEVYGAIKEQAHAAIPSGLPFERVYFSGHSYGGALAHLAGLDYCERVGDQNVEILTFGEPRALTAGYTRYIPAAHWRFTSPNDPVPNLPAGSLDVPDYAIWSAPVALSYDWKQWAWSHYGPECQLSPLGAINVKEPMPDPPPPGVSDGLVPSHLLANYAGRLRQNNNRFG